MLASLALVCAMVNVACLWALLTGRVDFHSNKTNVAYVAINVVLLLVNANTASSLF